MCGPRHRHRRTAAAPARRGAPQPVAQVAAEAPGEPPGAEELAALRAQLAGEQAAVRR